MLGSAERGKRKERCREEFELTRKLLLGVDNKSVKRRNICADTWGQKAKKEVMRGTVRILCICMYVCMHINIYKSECPCLASYFQSHLYLFFSHHTIHSSKWKLDLRLLYWKPTVLAPTLNIWRRRTAQISHAPHSTVHSLKINLQQRLWTLQSRSAIERSTRKKLGSGRIGSDEKAEKDR